MFRPRLYQFKVLEFLRIMWSCFVNRQEKSRAGIRWLDVQDLSTFFSKSIKSRMSQSFEIPIVKNLLPPISPKYLWSLSLDLLKHLLVIYNKHPSSLKKKFVKNLLPPYFSTWLWVGGSECMSGSDAHWWGKLIPSSPPSSALQCWGCRGPVCKCGVGSAQ